MFPVAIGLGVVAGTRRGTAADHVISSTTLAFIALPEFLVGTLLVLIFAVSLGLFPPVSLIPPGESPLLHPDLLVLPVATLCAVGSAYVVRMVRAGVLEAMTSDYVDWARLNGIRERRVVLRHGLRNALAPTVQVLALTLQWLVGGIIVVEAVFGYPGLGELLVQGVVTRDLPLVQAVATLIAIVYISINVVADLLVVLLIPKLRTAA
jgi:peptide/nickel transport system permease protein